MTPLQAYQAKINTGDLSEDPAQANVMQLLQSIHQQLLKRHQQRRSQYGKVRRRIKPRKPIKGLYLWGGVGIGKTELIDLFYHHTDVPKMRIHFFQFMQNLHDRLKQVQGTRNPLRLIGKELADQYLLICFDEFFVTNIADAMLLGKLFKALFEGGLCLITSSNIKPSNLYENGLQRERFMPAIELIQQHTTVINLSSKKDYRKQHIEQAGVYHTPLNQQTEQIITDSFDCYCEDQEISTEPLILFQRPINIIKRAKRTIWIDFASLCTIPRSQKDYLQLAKDFDTFIITRIPIISAKNRSSITLFIALIDILYDENKRVIISAAAKPAALYPSGALSFEYQRTCSRLTEMQSKDYLDRIK